MLRNGACAFSRQCVGWAKASTRRVHLFHFHTQDGGHASALPPTRETRSPRLHQRLARRRQFQKFLRAAAGIRMRATWRRACRRGGSRRASAAVERQSEHLPMAFLRRQRLVPGLAPAELRRGQRMHRFAENSEAAPRGILDAGVGVSIAARRRIGSACAAACRNIASPRVRAIASARHAASR